MIKKIFLTVIVIFLLFSLTAQLERQTTPDGTSPMTDQLMSEMENAFSETFAQIKESVSTLFNSITSSDDEEVTEIGEISVDQLPEEAQEYYKRYEKDNWETTTDDLEGNTHAGGEFKNKPKKNQTKLPDTDSAGATINYREFDAETTAEGNGRGTKRFVHGSDGSTYYTDNHYKTYKKIIN